MHVMLVECVSSALGDKVNEKPDLRGWHLVEVPLCRVEPSGIKLFPVILFFPQLRQNTWHMMRLLLRSEKCSNEKQESHRGWRMSNTQPSSASVVWASTTLSEAVWCTCNWKPCVTGNPLNGITTGLRNNPIPALSRLRRSGNVIAAHTKWRGQQTMNLG